MTAIVPEERENGIIYRFHNLEQLQEAIAAIYPHMAKKGAEVLLFPPNWHNDCLATGIVGCKWESQT